MRSILFFALAGLALSAPFDNQLLQPRGSPKSVASFKSKGSSGFGSLRTQPSFDESEIEKLSLGPSRSKSVKSEGSQSERPPSRIPRLGTAQQANTQGNSPPVGKDRQSHPRKENQSPRDYNLATTQWIPPGPSKTASYTKSSPQGGSSLGTNPLERNLLLRQQGGTGPYPSRSKIPSPPMSNRDATGASTPESHAEVSGRTFGTGIVTIQPRPGHPGAPRVSMGSFARDKFKSPHSVSVRASGPGGSYMTASARARIKVRVDNDVNGSTCIDCKVGGVSQSAFFNKGGKGSLEYINPFPVGTISASVRQTGNGDNTMTAFNE